MPVSFDHLDDRLVLRDGPKVLGEFRWQRNRLHDQPGVLRLDIVGFTTIAADELPSRLDEGVQALVDQMRRRGVLVLRTVVDHDDPLLPLLLERGFVETRRTLLPVLALDESSAPSPELNLRVAANRVSAETMSLRGGLRQHGETSLDELYWTLYRRSARHEQRRHITRQMLAAVVRTLRVRGTTFLEAEIDSDDPHTLYALAEWPFRHHSQSVTLTLLPQWH